ncbi:MAG: TlpA family protein disulfide reductase [Motiliproteus sp.]|nr:TlpA family protein disulfide reductase [Motiliproteus sp.]MCW9054098.1 TlpA family protein disulfide reductase [Motiliproteus sp.]
MTPSQLGSNDSEQLKSHAVVFNFQPFLQNWSLVAWVTAALLLSSLFTPTLMAAEANQQGFRGYTAPFVYTKPSTPATDVGFIDIEGNRQTLADYKGQVVLVNLWASWCGTCILEMPELEALQKKLGGKNFKVLTLNQDLKSGQQALAFLHQRGFQNLTGHIDPNYQFGQAFNQTLLPMTLLFDSQGRQIGHLIGAADWNSKQAQSLIKQFLPKLKPEPAAIKQPENDSYVLAPYHTNHGAKYFFNKYL